MQHPWNTATRLSPAIFPHTSVSRETGATNISREKSFSRSSTSETIPAAADWNSVAGRTPVKARVTVSSPVTFPTVGPSTLPKPTKSMMGKARLTDIRVRSRSSLVRSRWATASRAEISRETFMADQGEVDVLQ